MSAMAIILFSMSPIGVMGLLLGIAAYEQALSRPRGSKHTRPANGVHRECIDGDHRSGLLGCSTPKAEVLACRDLRTRV
jgi:hypothetical protein